MDRISALSFIKTNFGLKSFNFRFSLGIAILSTLYAGFFYRQNAMLADQQISLKNQAVVATQELDKLKNQDQYKINQKLQEEIKNIQSTYQKAVTSYEQILDLESKKQDTTELKKLYASAIKSLSDKDYGSAEKTLSELNSKIQKANDELAVSVATPKNIPVVSASTMPSSGYQKLQAQTSVGNFMVDVVAADLNSTKVIVDTASDSDCGNDCPVLPLATYTSRSGAFAGINGSYFCPATYPSCAGKTNSYDTLLMNKNKKYFNSDNNVYSTVPAVIFSGNSARFISKSLEWGRDTGVDAVLANYPMLVLNNQNIFGGSSDGKHTSKGVRNFVGTTGSTVYIGIVHNATVAEAAQVLQSLGVSNALNLDSGGSSALWSGGYKVGPGRNIPNALLLVRK